MSRKDRRAQAKFRPVPVRAPPSPVELLLAEGLRHHQSGRLDQAAAIYGQILERQPLNAGAWHLQGVIAFQRGRYADAVDMIRKAVAADGAVALFHVNLGNALQGLGQVDEAITAYGAALRLDPQHAEGHNNRAVLLCGLNRSREALGAYKRALALKPDFAEAAFNLGNLFQALEKFDQAVAVYGRALRQRPDYAEALYNLGTTLGKARRFEPAVTVLAAGIVRNPAMIDGYYNLGNCLKDLKRNSEAMAAFTHAVRLNPDHAEAWGNLGASLNTLGKLALALGALKRALVLHPKLIEAYQNSGLAMKDLGQRDAAVATLNTAIVLAGDNAEAYSSLGGVLAELGRLEEALAACRKAVEIDPALVGAHAALIGLLEDADRADEAQAACREILKIQPQWLGFEMRAGVHLPRICLDWAEIAAARAGLAETVARLAEGPSVVGEPQQKYLPTLFYLAYHGQNDRPLAEATCRFFRARLPILTVPAAPAAPPAGGRRIRLGILSAFLFGHTIGKLNQGYVRHLDRRRFEVVVIHAPGSRSDSVRGYIDEMADAVVLLPDDLAKAQQAVAELRLDILHYPDIGMSPFTYLLAYARLAPVQTASWGHPVTTGLDSIDYFLSFDWAEPDGAEAHYSETLVRLSRPPVFYEPFTVPETRPPRSDFGLPDRGALYGCPQSLFKFHPDFDRILEDIVRRDPSGWIICLEGHPQLLTQRLRARWSAAGRTGLLERVVFLPRLPLDRFMLLMTHMDVQLDPVHFGSGNTMYESLVYGVPVVTWPGQYMRGRIVSGIYRMLDLGDPPIAATPDEYSALAVDLANNRRRRQSLQDELLEKVRGLYADMAAVREFEDFLEAAAGGGKLRNWRWPGNRDAHG